ncbi:CoxG family protein [Ruegeria sp.]|uniref:CoxG family protein n=1 Tax=Ruegeria sp. TaxID=1879320 RepID=UPI003C7BB24A
MHLNDSRTIQATPSVVYAALLDPDVLKACIAGTQEISGNPDEGYEATVVQKVGPVKATFKGKVTMSDMIEAERLTITGEGKGGAAGFAKGSASVSLSPDDAGGTVLTYDVDAKVGGKLAQLGSRLIDGFARKMADQFFANLQEHLEGPKEQTEEEPDGEEPKKGWLGRLTGRE